MENMKKLNKIIFLTKILFSTKQLNPIHEARVLKLVFITIPCLKFWALLLQVNWVCVHYTVPMFNVHLSIKKSLEFHSLFVPVIQNMNKDIGTGRFKYK